MKKNTFVIGMILLLVLLNWFSIHSESAELPDGKIVKHMRCFYFAEGSTLADWHTYFTVQNLCSTQADVYVKFYERSGGTEVHQIPVPANSTYTANAATMLGRKSGYYVDRTKVNIKFPVNLDVQLEKK